MGLRFELGTNSISKSYIPVQLADGSTTYIKHIPWYKKGHDGWPIELLQGKPVRNFVRLLLQNIKKLVPRQWDGWSGEEIL